MVLFHGLFHGLAMTYRTLLLLSIEKYMACDDDSLEERTTQSRQHDDRLILFPYPAMLELAFPEVAFANRWCWRHFGPMDGECSQEYSEYRVCTNEGPHRHVGKWTTHWFAKTDYNFGFNEWYFSEQADRDSFLANLPEMNWGEHYPKA